MDAQERDVVLIRLRNRRKGGMTVDFEIADRIVIVMNELLSLDPDAISELVHARVKCKSQMASHARVQMVADADSSHMLGIMGILNGVIGTDDECVIASVGDDGKVIGFSHVTSHHDR